MLVAGPRSITGSATVVPRRAPKLCVLQEETRALREQLGGRRLRFTSAQRRRLTTNGKAHLVRADATPPQIVRSSVYATANRFFPSDRWRDGEYIRERFTLQGDRGRAGE